MGGQTLRGELASRKRGWLARGSYWFYDSRADPKAQADLYRQTLGDDLGELPLVADYEENYNGAYKGWRNLYNFLERLKSTGAKLSWDKVWIYTGYWYWMANSPQNDAAALNYFSHYKLWLAYYTINPANVRIPKPWADKTVKTWQWGTPTEGIERGVETTEIDMNKFTGTLDDFNTFFWAVRDSDPAHRRDTNERHMESHMEWRRKQTPRAKHE